jgi:CRISPR/Cas system-associated exonuclease Cas4 (RecB family)
MSQLEFWENDNPKPEAPAPKRAGSRVIRASEIGEYVYCHRAWWLGRVKGVENANRAIMDAGTARHRAHGQRVQRGDQLQRTAMALALVAILIGIAFLYFVVVGMVR